MQADTPTLPLFTRIANYALGFSQHYGRFVVIAMLVLLHVAALRGVAGDEVVRQCEVVIGGEEAHASGRLSFDGVDFDRLDFDALLFEPGDGAFDFVAVAFEFE
jgi:hypothetical protein